MTAFEDLLTEISGAMSDILVVLERQREPIADALLEGLRALPAPQVQVTVEPAPAVPAQIVFMPAEAPAPAPRGWKLTVSERDGNGRVRAISVTPE